MGRFAPHDAPPTEIGVEADARREHNHEGENSVAIRPASSSLPLEETVSAPAPLPASAVYTAPAGASPGTRVPDRAAVRAGAIALFALLVLSLVGRLGFTLWEPPFDGSLHFDDIAPLGDAYWFMNSYLGGPSYAVSFVATAAFLVLLGRGRASILTLAGALLIALAGLVFSLAIVAETLPFALAADPDVLPADEGRALFAVLNDNLDLLVPTIVVCQIVIALGAALGLVGMLLGRSTPRWLPIAGLVYVVVFQLLPVEALGWAFTMVGYVLQLALLGAIGWFGLRAVRRAR